MLDENWITLLQEFSDVEFVRPKPPIDENDKDCFALNDALCQDGRWCGVVTPVFSNNLFLVFFFNSPDEVEFGSSDLRIHKDWVDGNWVFLENQVIFHFYCFSN